MYKSIIKPVFDFLAALIGLLLLSPIFIIVTLLLTIANKGKPFFFQKRPGKNERVFSIIKFKTMNDATDKNGNLLPDEKRLTAVGRFVRKTSLDEIPQLINVLKGDMSLVGPRPFIAEYLDLYTSYQRKRFQVKPGISGLAQIRGRNRITWRNKLRYDVFYVKHQSFKFDLWILLQTVKKVFDSGDVNQDNNVTADKFTGFN
jgi:lipopolysaccharide/colanic/teichoic acid biosynthesis glycosyltransferase